jgi:hypothetical protein
MTLQSTKILRAALTTVLAAMLAVTSCLADQQADYMARVKENPTEDFSQLTDDQTTACAQADAMVYF